MKSYLYKLLDVQPGEGKRVGLLLLMGFSMGMFLATITVASQSLFLNNFSEGEWLPVAFLTSGACGLVATILYNVLQNRIPFGVLAGLSLLVITGLTAFLEFGAPYFSDPKYVYFIGFALIIPFSFILYLIFWGSFGRLFNTRQSKRLLGVVDAGAMFASFIAYFSIPQILKSVDTSSLYTISLVSVVSFFLLFLYLSTGYLNRIRSFAQERKYFQKVGIKQFFQSRYIVYMSLFIVVSMIVMNFVDYSFLNATTLFLDEDRLANFIAYFEMTIVIFNFLVQSFATDRIVAQYGMRVAMLINPVLIGAFTVAAVVLGSFGYSEVGNKFFLVFFIAIAMSKLFMSSLKDALDNQTFRLYLLPIESHLRIDVQTKIEGMVNAFAMLLAGGLIILINRIQLFDLIAITIFTVPLVGVWYYIANRMYKGYQHTLQSTLTRNKENVNESTTQGYTLHEVLEKGVHHTAEDKAIYALKLMENLEPAVFENSITRLTSSPSDKIREFAIARIKRLGFGADPHKQTLLSLAERAVDAAESSDVLSISPEKLILLGKSNKQADRHLAAKLLRNQLSNKTIFLLLEMLRDSNPLVRHEALLTARKVQRPETWSILIELLGSPLYSHHAAAALKEFGEQVLPALESAFHKSGQRDTVMLRIVQLMGRIGGHYALKLLWSKVDYPDKRIVKQILYLFRYMQYQVKGAEVREVFNLLETEIGKTLWNLAALNELGNETEFELIKNALGEEVEENYNHMHLLLSLLHDPRSVQLVRENLATGDPDSIAFALELLDVFVDAELKPRLFPILDDSPVAEKLQNLQAFYPRERYTPIQVLNYILNRDYNYSNRWTKACAIYTSAYVTDFRISRGLVAQVFNHDRLLQETAAWVVYGKDKSSYSTIRERLPVQDKRYLDSSIENNQLLDGLNDGFFLYIEMIMFIKQLPLFSHIHGNHIAELADKIVPLDLREGQRLTLEDSSFEKSIFIVAHGDVKLHLTDGTTIHQQRGFLYGDIFQDEDVIPLKLIEGIERAVIFKIHVMDFYFVMANNHELVDGLIKNANKKFDTQKSFNAFQSYSE